MKKPGSHNFDAQAYLTTQVEMIKGKPGVPVIQAFADSGARHKYRSPGVSKPK